jgi:hypothetical protein
MTSDELREYYRQAGAKDNAEAIAEGRIPAEVPPESLARIARLWSAAKEDKP